MKYNCENANLLINNYPALCNEWDFEHNKDIDIETITCGSNRKVWWICPSCHRSYAAVVYSRTHNGTGCKECSKKKRVETAIRNKISVGARTVADEEKLLNEWDYEKNECDPATALLGSQRKYWWICATCGHEWQADPCHRSSGRNCPICSHKEAGKKLRKKNLIVGKTDLETVNPSLAAEWHPSKNDSLKPNDVTPFSTQKVWWLCPVCGNEWQSTISGRSNGNGCPKCKRIYKSSRAEFAIKYYLQKYFPNIQSGWHSSVIQHYELDLYIPSLKLGIEYDGAKWHSNPKNDVVKAELCKSVEIELVKIREPKCPNVLLNCYVIKTEEPDVELMYLEKVIEELFLFIRIHYGLSFIPDVDLKRDSLEIYNSFQSNCIEHSLEKIDPSLAKQWDFEKNGGLTPDKISANNSKKIWWKCSNGHSWQATIKNRRNGAGCPYCSGLKAVRGETDLATKHPELMKEWDWNNNTIDPYEQTEFTHKKVFWICPNCNHQYLMSIANHTVQNSSCPYCNSHRLLSGYNDLETKYPSIAKQWDYTKNDDEPKNVMPGSHKKYWWLCDKGHSYQCPPDGRTRGRGCPYCAGKKVLTGFNDLATVDPFLASEWSDKNAIEPTDVTKGSHKKIVWKCSKCGNEWRATVHGRSNGNGCPACKATQLGERNRQRAKKRKSRY